MNANLEKAKESAYKLLREYNVISPPVPIVEIIESDGLSISITSLDELRSNDKPVCAALLKNQKVILIEKNDNPKRQRFSLAHELGHWKLHSSQLDTDPFLGILFRAPIEKETNPLEQEANQFGAHLLVPGFMLFKWFEITQNQHQLAKIFSVSSELMGWRLYNEGLIRWPI